MSTATQKSTVAEIRDRFDREVERFSNLATGQSAAIDAPLVLDLISECAAAATPRAATLLDVGCGAGNYTIKLLQKLPALQVTLVDLSRSMLDRAASRAGEMGAAPVTSVQADIRDLPLAPESFDIVLAAAVLHHLREPDEWLAVFRKFYSCLRAGGSLWVSDLVSHQNDAVQQALWRRYGQYLAELKGGSDAGQRYRDEVFAYIDREDTPRPLGFQLDLLKQVGFRGIDVLHKNGCFAAYGGIKP